MAIGTDRYASRADTLMFLACVGLSIAALSLPEQWRYRLVDVLQSVLTPFTFLQRQTELLGAARLRYDAVVEQRDSLALASAFMPELRNENARLRRLLGLGARLGGGYITAEILHQPEPTSPLSFSVTAGRREGVRPLSAVVSPEGLVGLVASVNEHTSIVLSWANPEFRASAIATDGSVVGVAAPHGAEGPGVWLLELQGVLYRQQVPAGTVIVTSGLGGVFPRGIPIGVVVGPAGEEVGWGRTYLIRPAVHPAELSHVMILSSARTAGSDLRNAFTLPPDSLLPGGAPPQ
ncbi:MAG TPA: rod shape-determining protein MreC [Gemmatimonadales bacterium]|jgi:rod shape-determining protein MreC|nr:rod shape-determining protein MreC [Gemmatimonadales bacterium]